MKIPLFIILFITSINTIYSQIENYNSVLKENVDTNGRINYKNIAENPSNLNIYLDYLSKTSPSDDWSLNKKKAFWLNAYNAYTIKIIIDNYPPKKKLDITEKQNSNNSMSFVITNTTGNSITYIKKNGKDAWNYRFAEVGDKVYTLNEIEHGIIRKHFNDGRIHFGLNAASYSGPKFMNFTFTEQNIEKTLEKLTQSFINDISKNKISNTEIEISKVFEWYPEDFNMGDIITFINQYSEVKILPNTKVKYMNYNWKLNDNK
ncbi:DUF547 domain-containing protein [uncultured Tenacibaculum sp.]|uniref:DUF547 domain-containing protein n=1 Tax=uncultured Tenacibaculum sp. TaxID=174713 RepID=UPI002607F4B0|nr:DUF547 domain-containing protein [uncultured Tenacibaculum sp.]